MALTAGPAGPAGSADAAAASQHPLAAIIEDAAEGRFLDPDGGWRRLPPLDDGIEAVVAFTGHAVFCLGADIPDDRLRVLGADGWGGAHAPRLVADIAGPGAWMSSLDVLMAARATGRGGLVARPDLTGHPRVAYASRLRRDIAVLGFPDPARRAVAVVGRGLAGLVEVGMEVEPERRARGDGRDLVLGALGAVAPGALVVACVAPGNAASLRSLLGVGFVPLGAVQLVRRSRR